MAGVRLQSLIIALIIMACYSSAPLCASAAPESRRVLALYDSAETTIIESNIHGRLEMPLNRLGLAVDYLDVATASLDDTSAYRGIVIWFNDQRMKKPHTYLRWLLGELKKKQRVVLIGSLGAETNEHGIGSDRELYTDVLNAIGIDYGPYGSLTDPFRVVYQNSKGYESHFGFETDIQPTEMIYHDLRPSGHGMRAWREIYLRDTDKSNAIAIGVGERGGFISEPRIAYRIFFTPQWQIRWDLNPFSFLEAALAMKGIPRLDLTTVNNCRMAFSHIDGDGMANESINLPGSRRISPQVCYEEILQKNSYPITIGLVAARIDKKGLVHNRLKLFRDIMKLPHVSPAAHGYCHPMNWSTGEVGINYPGYTFSNYMETVGALKLVDRLTTPADKKSEVFLWTGDCDPTAEQIALLRKHGYLNINGGNSRLDSIYNGHDTLAPLAVYKGRELQIYAQAGNEYLYTNGWTQNKGGFSHIIDTFERTATPRLLPVNLYYHFYLCENQSGLTSLKKIYAWLDSQELNWVTLVEYCRMVIDFTSAKLQRLDDKGDAWGLQGNGHLTTLRFDNEDRAIDMTQSRGVLGWDHFNGSLYVSVNAADVAIYLGSATNEHLSLKRSTYYLRNATVTPKTLRARLQLYSNDGFIELRCPTKPRVSINGKAHPFSFDKGICRITFPAGEAQQLELSVEL